jgi:hypothetical protein
VSDTVLPTATAMCFYHGLHTVSTDRNFIPTAKGYIGWAPELPKEGDLIVLMPGGKVPYDLRPVQSDQDTKPPD